MAQRKGDAGDRLVQGVQVLQKWLLPDRVGICTEWQWPRPGVWAPKVMHPMLCKRGYHVITTRYLSNWIMRVPMHLWDVEVRGGRVKGCDKSAHAEARLIRQYSFPLNARELWVTDCAAHVLNRFERICPNDDRPRKAIQARRKFIAGSIGEHEWDEARRGTIMASNEVARMKPGRGIVYAWKATSAARVMSSNGSPGAITSCAHSVSQESRNRERTWQGKRILYYAECAKKGIAPVLWPLPKRKS